MAEIGNPLSFAFWTGQPANTSLSYDALQSRRRIAEALAGKAAGRAFPKNIGEGIYSAASDLTDAWQMRGLDEQERRQSDYENARLRGGPAAESSAGRTTSETPLQRQVAEADDAALPSAGATLAIGGQVPGGPSGNPAMDAALAAQRQVRDQDSYNPPPVPGTLGPSQWPSGTKLQAYNGPPAAPGSFGQGQQTTDPSAGTRNRLTQTVIDAQGAVPPRVQTASLTPAFTGQGYSQPGTSSEAPVPPMAATAPVPYANPPTMTGMQPMPDLGGLAGAAASPAPSSTPPPAPAPVLGPAVAQPGPVERAPPVLPPSQAGSLPTPPRPYDPGPQPTMPPPTREMQYLRGLANDRGLSPTTRAQAQNQYNELLKGQRDAYVSDLQAHKAAVIKSKDPATQQALTKDAYAIEKESRALQGEGLFEMPPEMKARLGKLPEGVTAYIDRWGNPKFIHGPQTVSIEMTGEKAEAQGIGKHAAERHGKMMESANTAGNSLYALNRAEALLSRIDTNALAPTAMTVGAFGRALGISDQALAALNLKPEQIGSRQAFNAIVGDLVIGKIGAGGFPSNNFSNTDRSFLTDTVAKLGDDPESNRIKLASAKLVAHRDLEKAQEWSAFRNAPENKGKSFNDFEDHWNAKVSRNDLTGELRKQAENLISSTSDNAAREWLRTNPNDPRAPAIRQRLGL
jgi:hypothetical protein